MREAVEVGAGGLSALGLTYLCRRYTILFYTLLLTMVAVPLFAAFELTGALIDYLLAASLLAAVMPVDTARSRRVVLTVTALVWLDRRAARSRVPGRG